MKKIIFSFFLLSPFLLLADAPIKDFFTKKSPEMMSGAEEKNDHYCEQCKHICEKQTCSDEKCCYCQGFENYKKSASEYNNCYVDSCEFYSEVNPCCSWKILVHGEYLLFWLCQDGLDIAGRGSTYPESIKEIDFDRKQGYRLGGGFYFCENWALEANYTYLHPKGKKKIASEEIFPTLIPQLVVPGDLTTRSLTVNSVGQSVFKKANSDIDFDYKVIDIELRRNIRCSCLPNFYFDAIAGVQIACINEKWDTLFLGSLDTFFDIFPDSLPFELQAIQKWEFDGIGLKIGGYGEYQNSWGFLLFASGRLNILYGRYKNQYIQNVLDLSPNALVPQFLTIFNQYYTVLGKERYCDFNVNFRGNLGIGFDAKCSCKVFRIKASWEMIYWSDLAQIRRGLSGKGLQVDLAEEVVTYHSTSTNVTERIAHKVGMHGFVASVELGF